MALLGFEVRHWISNHEAGIGDSVLNSPKAVNTVGDIFGGTKGYLAIWRGGFQTFLVNEQAPGPTNTQPPQDLLGNFIRLV